MPWVRPYKDKGQEKKYYDNVLYGFLKNACIDQTVNHALVLATKVISGSAGEDKEQNDTSWLPLTQDPPGQVCYVSSGSTGY